MAVSVPETYRHLAKRAVSLAARSGDGSLKVYHLTAQDVVVLPEAETAFERWLVARRTEVVQPEDRGFVILHRCGAEFHFLLVSVWREANELWEAVWYKDGSMADFMAFDPAYPPENGSPRPTFCVWELAIVTHEALAWQRFLRSKRDADAEAEWREDCYTGAA